MKNNILTKLASVSAGAILSLAFLEFQSAQAAALYSITDLGSFGEYPDFTAGRKINDVGQVIVSNFQYSSSSIPAKQQFFLWENGKLKDLTAFNSLSSSAQLGLGGSVSDINNSGQLVGGWTDLTGQAHPLLGNQDSVTDLGSFNGNTENNSAIAINDLGQVVGGAIAKTPDGQVQYLGWLWENGITTGLNSPDNPSFSPSEINNLGQIVGVSFPISQAPISRFDAVVITSGQVTKLPALNGSTQNSGNDINNLGQVIGYSNNQAVLWSDGDVFGLGILGYNVNTYSVATGINDLGQVVGYSSISEASPLTGQRHAFLWDGQLNDLNDLIEPESVWELEDALDINNKGQIVGRGILNDQYHAYLLTPISVPQPVPESTSTLGFLSLGVVSLGSAIKRKKTQKTTVIAGGRR